MAHLLMNVSVMVLYQPYDIAGMIAASGSAVNKNEVSELIGHQM